MTEEVQTLKKDKQKVTEEHFTDEMLKQFLQPPVPSGDDDDYRRLLFAYRGMPVEAFARFLVFFREAGHNLAAKDAKGRDFQTYLRRFPAQKAYAEAFEAVFFEKVK